MSTTDTTNGNQSQILVGGEGGQGVLVTGIMLAQAAAINGSYVAQSARYGAAVRGGEATASVVIADEIVDFPHVEHPDYLIVVSQQTYDKYVPAQAEGTWVFYDPFFVKPAEHPTLKQVGIEATQSAINTFGKSTAANLIMLSALVELTQLVSEESVVEAIKQNLSKKFLDVNLQALELGRELARAAGKVEP